MEKWLRPESEDRQRMDGQPLDRWCMQIAVYVLLAAALVACSDSGVDGSGRDDDATGSGRSSSQCEQAWQAFADIDDLHDTLADVVPTLSACSSLDEWIAVGESIPGHGLIVARITVKNLCRFQPGARGTPVCQSL